MKEKLSLDQTNPELINEWNDKRNISEFTYGSKYKAEWKCVRNHKWKTVISNRSVKKFKCPYCSGRKILKGFNDLNTTHFYLANEWFDNKKSPYEVTKGSHYKAKWKCKYGHIWNATVRTRAVKNYNCPYCSGRFTIIGETDLLTTHPELFKEWDDERRIEEFSSGSDYKAKWKCKYGHEWKTAICNRTKPNSSPTSCPKCWASSNASKSEQELHDFIFDTIKPLKLGIIQSDREVLNGKELDIYIPELKIAFEYNGEYWHSDKNIKNRCGISSYEYHKNKLDMTKEKGVKLFFVWENDWNREKETIKLEIIKIINNNDYNANMFTRLK